MINKFILAGFWGGWLGVSLNGNLTDWYWWMNALVLNLTAPFVWGDNN
jgi:hypothetical protein